VRGLLKVTGCVLVAALSVSLVSPSALADLRDHDPDDTPTTFDIRAIRTLSHLSSGAIIFATTFYDVLDWRRSSELWIYVDSRAGPAFDHVVVASKRSGVVRCELFTRHSLFGPVGVNAGPRRVTCRPKRRFLNPTHTIRFKVRAISHAAGHLVNDWAPGGFGDWYPHV
jgi:hypothetical protein